MEHSGLQFRIAEIDVRTQQTDEKIVGMFRYEHTGAIKHGPVLFIIAEIHSTLYVYERLLDVINATAEQARYLVAGVGQDPVGRFEKLVQRLNEAVAEFSSQEASPVAWNRVNIYVLELSDGHLCFTGVGEFMNLFLQKQADGSFRAFDMLGSMERPDTIDPHKPFASLVCGDIHADDVLCIGTSNLNRIRAELRFKERMITLPPVTAALEITQDLEKRHVPDHFFATIIRCLKTKAPASPPSVSAISVEKSTSSIEKLRGHEEEAAKQLAPILSPVEDLKHAAITQWLTRILRRCQTLFITLWKRIPKKSERVRHTLPLASLRSLYAGRGSFFPHQRKSIVISGAVLLVIIGSGVLWRVIKNRTAERALWTATFERAVDARNRAESDTVYGNDARAQAHLVNAEQILAGLPKNIPDRRGRAEQLLRELSEVKERLRKNIKLEQSSELVALETTAPEGSLVAPILSKDRAYVIDNHSHAVLRVKLESKEMKRIELPQTAGRIVSAAEGKDVILLANTTGNIFGVKKADDTIQALPWTHTKSSSTIAIVLYASKLYSLDPQHAQVWRYLNTGNGFSGQKAYIKNTTMPISDAVSFAIDSNVYILKQNGQLVRLLSGSQETFALRQVDPPLRSASSIWAGAESAHIVISDPYNKRVLVFDKTGALKAQLISSHFSSPRGAIVDEKNKRILVLDGNRLLLAPMPSIK